VGRNLYSVPDTTRRRVLDVHVLADAISIFEDGAPQDITLRADGRIWKIFRNALGIFSLDLHQAFLPGDRHLTERNAIGLAQL
jgi:hypothetical protein